MLLKIFSYNIHGLPIISEDWAKPLALWFNDTDYDIICLQEVFTQGRVEILTSSLKKNGYTVLNPNDSKNNHNLFSSGLLTGIKTNIWSVVSDHFITFNLASGVDFFANKGFHCIELEHRVSNEHIIIINTHMQSDNPTNFFTGCVDTKPIRHSQAQQLCDYLGTNQHIRHFLVGDLNSEIESHEDMLYLTGPISGIMKHTFPETGEDLDHVAILPKIWSEFSKPIVKEVGVLTKLNWSDHWPIHVVLFYK
jgi:exonuclease III